MRVAYLAPAVILFALIKLGVHLLTSFRYGYHRDELYFLEAARHLDWGFVDFPPVVPLLAAVVRATIGDSLLALRLLPAAGGTALVLLAGLIARELGGGRFAHILSAVSTLAAPVLLASNGLLGTVTVDQLTWTMCAMLLARLVRTGNARLWIWLGIAAGVGLLTKYTIAVFLLGLVIGFVSTGSRSWLATRWPYLAAAAAGLIVLPNLLWQQAHGWPTLEFLQHQETSATAESSIGSFLLNQLLLPGPLAVPLLVAGLWFLFMRARLRPLAWASASAFVIFAGAGGKAYYTSPLYPLLFSAGAVYVEELTGRTNRKWVRPAVVAAIIVAVIVPLPVVLPVLPAETMIAREIYKARPDYADMFGWEDLAATVAHVYEGLPADERSGTVILARNYGEAAAIDFFGRSLGLPGAVSGHNSYWFWRPSSIRPLRVIAVGFPDQVLPVAFIDCRKSSTLSNRHGVRNEEWGRPVHVCRPRGPLDTQWPSFKRFNA